MPPRWRSAGVGAAAARLPVVVLTFAARNAGALGRLVAFALGIVGDLAPGALLGQLVGLVTFGHARWVPVKPGAETDLTPAASLSGARRQHQPAGRREPAARLRRMGIHLPRDPRDGEDDPAAA